MRRSVCTSHNRRSDKFGYSEVVHLSGRGGRHVRVPMPCEWCGAEFQAIRSRIGTGEARFCSRSCASRYGISKRPELIGRTGSDNPNWKGGVSLGSHAHYNARFRVRNPEKVAAQKRVASAIHRGELVRPDACSQCAAPCKPHAHHDDYAQPLSVRWLCRLCHIRHHHLGRRKKVA